MSSSSHFARIQFDRKTLIFSILIPLSISAFTHIWNPLGYPAFHVDEGHYMRRAMQVIEGLGPQETMETYDYIYDHPYFGQIFLAATLSILNYPEFLNPSPDLHSIELLYFIPRVLMGILAVIDTLLVYKIADASYNRKVAFISSTLFALMPLNRIIRGILLDSLELPLVLLSILFAIYYSKSCVLSNSGQIKNSNMLLIPISGIFLGLAIFTKIPMFTFIPLVTYIILIYGNKMQDSFRSRIIKLAAWFIPVILISSLWPIYAISAGQFDEWLSGVIYQTTRDEGTDLGDSISQVLRIDPLITILGLCGVIYSVIRRDYFVLLWVLPYLLFLYLIGWVVYFHWAILFPALTIALGIMIDGLRKKLDAHKYLKLLPYGIMSSCVIFGLLVTVMLLPADYNKTYNEVYELIVQELDNNNASISHNDPNSGTTLIGGHRMRALIWIPKYVLDDDVTFRDTSIQTDNFTRPLETNKFLLVADSNLISKLLEINLDQKHTLITKYYYNMSQTIASFIEKEMNRHNFLNLRENHGFGPFVEVRANY